MVLKPILIHKPRGEQQAPGKPAHREVIVVPSALGDYRCVDDTGSASEGVDVIDLGGPRRARPTPVALRPRSALSRSRPLYTPNPRLYPGPATRTPPKRKERASSGRGRRRKRVFRRPVPNSRLYRPAPPRPAAPPARPCARWPPPAGAPPHALDTASRAALHLLSARLASPARGAAPAPSHTPPDRRLVVKLPAPPRYAPASEHFRARDSESLQRLVRTHAMDTATRHSTSPDCSDGNEPSSAPSEFLAEFLSAIMRRQYAEALKYCRLILQYEPHNATARGFYPLLQHKLSNHKNTKEDTSSSEDASPPHNIKNECDSEGSGGMKSGGGGGADGADGAGCAVGANAGTGGAGTGTGTGEDSEEAWDESERSGASCSSLELDSSSPSRAHNSRSTRSSDSAWSRWESSGSRSERDDNGNERAPRTPPAAPSAPAAPADNAHAPHSYTEGDIENDNAAAGDAFPPHALKASTSAAASLRRLRAQFACSTK